LLRGIADGVDSLALAGHVVKADGRVPVEIRTICAAAAAIARRATESVLAMAARTVAFLVAALPVDNVWDAAPIAVIPIEAVRVRITSDLAQRSALR